MSAKAFGAERRQRARSNARLAALDGEYKAFDQLDGRHPLQTAVPESCVMYDVRLLPDGKVSYFNWELAKEMGLIPEHHPHRMNRALEDKLLETFCIRIVNEWDKAHNVTFPPTMMKKNQYMATRYLQLQHADKAGRTSGDGRCVWNGVVRHRGKIWDVSSRGTGVTSLAPGAVIAGKPLRSGNNEHGYGCGMAEIDELYAAAIMAEIFHRQGISTERVLLIVDLGKGMGIGVRAGHNLIRPAHLFAHLKQNELDRLKRSADYLIQRQQANGEWKISLHSRKRYELMGQELATSFARFAAQLDREYIFAWLDWDGDNVLINSGIIDYGSVRQFGLRHDQYRYDDVERYSTNLNEQKAKTRMMVQTFAQMVDALQTGTRKPLEKFRRHPFVRLFDQTFEHHLLNHFLYQVGFTDSQRSTLLSKHRSLIERFFQDFSYLERMKTYRRMRRVADGVNRPAIFNMRIILGHLPENYLGNIAQWPNHLIPSDDLFTLMLSDFAEGRDKRLTTRLSKRLRRLQLLYKNIVKKALGRDSIETVLKSLSERASRVNRSDRITGNALIHVVDELLKARRRGFNDAAIQEVMNAVISDQSLTSDIMYPPVELSPKSPARELFSHVLTLVQDHKEEI